MKFFRHRLGAALLIALLLCAVYSDACAPVSLGYATARAEAPSLTAESAILIDADSGRVLLEKDADTRRAPASTTKIMTCLLALERGGLDRTVVVPDSAGTVPADSTRVPVYPGERMPLRDLLYGLMIKSGNDAANAIATLADGSVAAFTARMNERAEALQMTNTQFKNPHGYPVSGHYTTARDLATLTRAALKTPGFEKVLTTRSYTLSATSLRGAQKIANGYAILNEDSPYYDARVLGGKTGYSGASGQCFVCVASQGGKRLIAVVLKAGYAKPEKWIDAKALFDYGFSAA